MRSEDEGLRLLALEQLGDHAPALARSALEAGVVELDLDVLSWEGSSGVVHAHRVLLELEPELAARVRDSPSVMDALTAAFAAAVSRAQGNALAAIEVVPTGTRPRASPYRGRL
jgi:hypothetical protein